LKTLTYKVYFWYAGDSGQTHRSGLRSQVQISLKCYPATPRLN